MRLLRWIGDLFRTPRTEKCPSERELMAARAVSTCAFCGVVRTFDGWGKLCPCRIKDSDVVP